MKTTFISWVLFENACCVWIDGRFTEYTMKLTILGSLYGFFVPQLFESTKV